MNLFHTSPNLINEIHKEGLFESFLCFSEDEYVMTAGNYYTYEIEIDEDQLIEACSIFYQENAYELCKTYIDEICAKLNCDEEIAIELLSEKTSLPFLDFELSEDKFCDISFRLQLLSAKCAKALGYKGVKLRDEQGTLYLIDMFENEKEMRLV